MCECSGGLVSVRTAARTRPHPWILRRRHGSRLSLPNPHRVTWANILTVKLVVVQYQGYHVHCFHLTNMVLLKRVVVQLQRGCHIHPLHIINRVLLKQVVGCHHKCHPAQSVRLVRVVELILLPRVNLSFMVDKASSVSTQGNTTGVGGSWLTRPPTRTVQLQRLPTLGVVFH